MLQKCYFNSGCQLLNVCSDYNVLLIIVLKKSFSRDFLDSHTQSQWEYFSHLYTWYLLQQGTKISVFSSQLSFSVEHFSFHLAPENVLLWWQFRYSCFISYGTASMMLSMVLKSLLCNIYLLLHKSFFFPQQPKTESVYKDKNALNRKVSSFVVENISTRLPTWHAELKTQIIGHSEHRSLKDSHSPLSKTPLHLFGFFKNKLLTMVFSFCIYPSPDL